jgi:hypothetical protein
MSVASEIARLTGLKNRLKTKLKNLGLLTDIPRGGEVIIGDDLSACTQAVESISGTKSMTNTSQQDVAGYQYAQVQDANLISSNIAQGVTILGVTGTHSGSTPTQQTQSKSMYLGGASAPATVYPDSGYLLSEVTPAMDANPTLIPANIKSGVQIMGVTGTYHGAYGSIRGGTPSANGSTLTFSNVSFGDLLFTQHIDIHLLPNSYAYPSIPTQIITMSSTAVSDNGVEFEGWITYSNNTIFPFSEVVFRVEVVQVSSNPIRYNFVITSPNGYNFATELNYEYREYEMLYFY